VVPPTARDPYVERLAAVLDRPRAVD